MTYHSQNWWGVPRNMSKESRNPTTPRVKYILCWSCCWGDSSSSFRRHSTIAWYLLASDSDWRCIFPSIRLDCGYRPVHASSRPKTRNYRVVVDRATTCVLHIQYLRCTNGEQSKQNNKHERAKFLTRFVNCAFATLLDAHRLRTGWLPGQQQRDMLCVRNDCCVAYSTYVFPQSAIRYQSTGDGKLKPQLNLKFSKPTCLMDWTVHDHDDHGQGHCTARVHEVAVWTSFSPIEWLLGIPCCFQVSRRLSNPLHPSSYGTFRLILWCYKGRHGSHMVPESSPASWLLKLMLFVPGALVEQKCVLLLRRRSN